MADFNDLAARMFGDTTPTSQPTQTSAMPSTDPMAERLFGDTTRATQHSAPNRFDKRPFDTLSDSDKAERMFKTDDHTLNHGDSMRSLESYAMEQRLASPEEAADIAGEWGEVFSDFGLNSTESKQATELGIAAFSNPPSAALVESWVEESKAVLVADYGPRGAAQALADAQAMIQMHASPELREVLISTGLGNSPQIIRMAAARARAMRQAGKL